MVLIGKELNGGFATKYIKHGEKVSAKYADEIIVLSKNVQDYFEKEYGRKTHFISNGVSKLEIKKASNIEKKYNLKKDSYILYLEEDIIDNLKEK